MRNLILVFLALVSISCGKRVDSSIRNNNNVMAAQERVAIQEVGVKNKQPIIFIHGGPGFNSASFEFTTARPLADMGFYVITYDQRGQGRSGKTNVKNYTYKKYADDLNEIIKTRNLKDPILIAHSHGGPIAIKFDEYYPKVAKAIVLVDAPLNFWSTIQDSYQKCSEKYKAAGSAELLKDLEARYKALDTQATPSDATVENLSKFFAHTVVGCKLYRTANPTEKEKKLRAAADKVKISPDLASMPGFLFNEKYIYLNHTAQVNTNKGRYFAIYGDEDGLFGQASLEAIRNVVEPSRFRYIANASHEVFIDQQEIFLKAFKDLVSTHLLIEFEN